MVVVSRVCSVLARFGPVLRTALVLFPSIVAVGCGSRSELYAIGGFGDGGDDGGPGDDASEDGPEDAPFDVGADVQCKGKAINLTLNAPNLYFVIDHSTSMTALNKWSNIRTAIANLMTQLGAGARFGVTLFPGARGTNDNCQVGAEVMSAASSGRPERGRREHLPQRDDLGCALGRHPDGGDPAQPRPEGSPACSTARRTVILATDGGPNCNSVPLLVPATAVHVEHRQRLRATAAVRLHARLPQQLLQPERRGATRRAVSTTWAPRTPRRASSARRNSDLRDGHPW